MRTTIYRWAKSRGLTPQTAYSWRAQGLPTNDVGRVDPEEADTWLQMRMGRRRQTGASKLTDGEPIDLAQLAALEEEAIVKGLSSLAFLRAQGRTLLPQSQPKFVDFMWHGVYDRLQDIVGQSRFDEIHDEWVRSLQGLLRTARGERLSYGQGQKSLNVAIKFVVDWAGRPDEETAEALRPLLHCPLDKVVMSRLRRHDAHEFVRRIRPLYRGIYGPRLMSLSTMDKTAYRAWQSWIREIVPSKPALLDIVWVFERPGALPITSA